MISDLQKARIRFHLGFSPLAQYDQLVVDNLDAFAELQVVGTDLDYDFLDQPLCQTGSALYNCEVAYSKLSPDSIDDSLFVGSVNAVKLRHNELAKREELHKWHCEKLAQLTNNPTKKTTPRRRFYGKNG